MKGRRLNRLTKGPCEQSFFIIHEKGANASIFFILLKKKKKFVYKAEMIDLRLSLFSNIYIYYVIYDIENHFLFLFSFKVIFLFFAAELNNSCAIFAFFFKSVSFLVFSFNFEITSFISFSSSKFTARQ